MRRALRACFKNGMDKKSGQTAELNSDHGDINPGFGAGDRAFVVAHQSALVHQPTEGAFDDPTVRQHFKALHIIRAFDISRAIRRAGKEYLRHSNELDHPRGLLGHMFLDRQNDPEPTVLSVVPGKTYYFKVMGMGLGASLWRMDEFTALQELQHCRLLKM